jgi:hypothetical protein
MSGKKSMVLVGKHGHSINHHYCYKKLKSAVRRSMDLAYETREPIMIWHNEAGREVALVNVVYGSFRIEAPSPKLFKRLWSES